MSDLDKRISGDWIDAKEKMGDTHALIEYMGITAADLKDLASRLRLAVEGGIVEYKHAALAPVFTVLESARFKSLSQDDILALEKPLAMLQFAILAQRLIALDALPWRRPEAAEAPDFSVGQMNMNAILADLKARLAQAPALRAHAAVKNIMAQVQIYNRETAKMNELKATIRPEMQTAFMANFNKTFATALASIRRNYETILREEEERRLATERKDRFSLRDLPLKDLAPFLLSQAREVARLRSSLAHARDEKWKMREILVGLYDRRQEVIALMDRETSEYGRLCVDTPKLAPGACAREAPLGFRDELIALCDRQSRGTET